MFSKFTSAMNEEINMANDDAMEAEASEDPQAKIDRAYWRGLKRSLEIFNNIHGVKS